MNDDTKIDKLNELLPQLSQQEILSSIWYTSYELMKGSQTKKEAEFANIFAELDDYSNRISVIQALANSLEKIGGKTTL